MTSDTFLDLCDLAMCSPDFDVIYSFTDPQAVAWLTTRLQRQGHSAKLVDVEAAYVAWRNRPRGAEHHVGTIRL